MKKKKYPRFILWYGIPYKYKKYKKCKKKNQIQVIGKNYKKVNFESEIDKWEKMYVKDFSTFEFSPQEAVLMPEFNDVINL